MPDFKAYCEDACTELKKIGHEAGYFGDATKSVGTFDAYPRDRHTYRIIVDVGMSDLQVFDPVIRIRQGDFDSDIPERKVPPSIKRIAEKMQSLLRQVAERHLQPEATLTL